VSCLLRDGQAELTWMHAYVQ